MGWRRANCFPWLSTAVLGIQYNRNAAQPHVRCKGTQHGRRVACQSAASSVTDNDCLWIWIVTTYAQWRRLHMAQGAHAPLLQMAGHGAPRSIRRSNKTDQTVLPITKALTKTTNCTCRAKKVEKHDQKKFMDTCPPTFKFVPAPLHMLSCYGDPGLVLELLPHRHGWWYFRVKYAFSCNTPC